eukprot:CAMPEP_0184857856 /NCGR_PEP_ID=MMETSP0580-20130426/3002_1 /TAXON_ID=1118495 /ORGANISM="Dactyliosolen fragilissimus" /LENGTH=280 /DNA_ID=CAMNT_0027353701 /DNA_START=37 /DNA_END=879 /DNA_ORIENTATION=-
MLAHLNHRNASRQLMKISNRHYPQLASLVTPRYFSTTDAIAELKAEEENTKAREALEAEKSSVQKYVEATRQIDTTMVWGTTVAPPDPVLPEKPSEIAALDPAHDTQDMPSLVDGGKRLVHIKQEQASVTQSPLNIEKEWFISFMEEGEAAAQCWENPLMGWVSSADPLASNMRLQMSFNTAADAVYFAKKRGWDFVVDEPMLRKGRSDDALYQDNFLSQAVAGRVRREKSACAQWSRPESGTSHYFRPLKYHGDGTVNQHGPNGDKDIDPHVEGYYKIR